MHADQVLPKEALDYPTSGKFKIEVWQSMFNSVAVRSEFIGRLFHAGAIIGELINACDAEYYKVAKTIPRANLCDYIAFVNYKTLCARRESLENPRMVSNIEALNEAYLETLGVLLKHNKNKLAPYYDDFTNEVDQAVNIVSQRSYLLNLWKKVRDFNFGIIEDAKSILFYPLDRELEFGRVAAIVRAQDIRRQIGFEAIRNIEKYGEYAVVLSDISPLVVPAQISLGKNGMTLKYSKPDKDYHLNLYMMVAQIPFYFAPIAKFPLWNGCSLSITKALQYWSILAQLGRVIADFISLSDTS